MGRTVQFQILRFYRWSSITLAQWTFYWWILKTECRISIYMSWALVSSNCKVDFFLDKSNHCFVSFRQVNRIEIGSGRLEGKYFWRSKDQNITEIFWDWTGEEEISWFFQTYLPIFNLILKSYWKRRNYYRKYGKCLIYILFGYEVISKKKKGRSEDWINQINIFRVEIKLIDGNIDGRNKLL